MAGFRGGHRKAFLPLALCACCARAVQKRLLSVIDGPSGTGYLLGRLCNPPDGTTASWWEFAFHWACCCHFPVPQCGSRGAGHCAAALRLRGALALQSRRSRVLFPFGAGCTPLFAALCALLLFVHTSLHDSLALSFCTTSRLLLDEERQGQLYVMSVGLGRSCCSCRYQSPLPRFVVNRSQWSY